MITPDEIQDFIPWILGTAATFIALKKDWIKARFTNKQESLAVDLQAEDVESKQLMNVEKQLMIYKDLLDDAKARFDGVILELREEIDGLNSLVKEQKVFIRKQRKDLDECRKSST